MIQRIASSLRFFGESTKEEKKGKESNFERAQTETVDSQGIGYDYRSVMHYSADAFSRNGLPTIEPKVSGSRLGQRDGFSKKDIQKILKMYGCTKKDSGYYSRSARRSQQKRHPESASHV